MGYVRASRRRIPLFSFFVFMKNTYYITRSLRMSIFGIYVINKMLLISNAKINICWALLFIQFRTSYRTLLVPSTTIVIIETHIITHIYFYVNSFFLCRVFRKCLRTKKNTCILNIHKFCRIFFNSSSGRSSIAV